MAILVELCARAALRKISPAMVTIHRGVTAWELGGAGGRDRPARMVVGCTGGSVSNRSCYMATVAVGRQDGGGKQVGSAQGEQDGGGHGVDGGHGSERTSD